MTDEFTRNVPIRRLLRRSTLSTVDEADFAKDVAEMVADHAPRLFAIVLEYGTQIEARIVAWGMELDEGAYMTTVDGRRQYALADAEGALRYIRGNPDTTPRLVWVAQPTHG